MPDEQNIPVRPEAPEPEATNLEEGQAVEFEVTQGAKGKQAANVRPV